MKLPRGARLGLCEEQVERLCEASAVDEGYQYRFIREVRRV
jgi:hypothetical protein